MNNNRFLSKNMLVILAASLLYMASPMLVNPLIAGYAESLGAGSTIMGLIGGIMNLVSLAFQPFSGNLADRISKYKLAVIGTVLMIIPTVGYIFSANAGMVLFFRILNGFGFAICTVCFSTWFASVVPQNRIGYAMGIYGMANALAMAIGPAIGINVYKSMGYKAAFIVATAFSVICLLLCRFSSDKGEPVRTQSSAKPKLQLIDIRVLPLALVITCFAIPFCATQSFLVRYTESLQLSVAVGYFFTIYAAVLLISRLFISRLLDKVKFGFFLVFCLASLAASLLLLTVMNNNFHMVLAASALSLAYGLMSTVAQSSAILRVEPEKRGLATGTYYVGVNTGMALGPIIGGVLYGSLPLRSFYPVLMLTIPACILLYFVSSKLVNVYLKHTHRES